jgi:hypothetical protein
MVKNVHITYKWLKQEQGGFNYELRLNGTNCKVPDGVSETTELASIQLQDLGYWDLGNTDMLSPVGI